jgi:hypothetical protein
MRAVRRGRVHARHWRSLTQTLGAISFFLAWAPGAHAEKPRKYLGQALLVGIQNYQKLDPKDSLRPIVAHDVQLVREALIRVGYDPDAVTVLTNAPSLRKFSWVTYEEKLGRNHVIAAVKQLKDPGSADVTLVYISGHGGTSDDYRNMALYDSEPNEGTSYLAVNVLAETLSRELPTANHKLVVTDACSHGDLQGGDHTEMKASWAVNALFSSRLKQPSQLSREEPVELEEAPDEPESGAFELRSTDRASSRRKGVSLFTKFFVTALQRTPARSAGSGDLMVNDLYDDIERQMSEYWKGALPCESTDQFGQALGGGQLKVPDQCPWKVFHGSNFAVARHSLGPCEGLTKTADESAAQLLARQQECASKAKNSP